MLEVRDLRLVRAINDEGSLARAARVLGMAQPGLTRSLAALEARLRGRLFERNRRGMVPTDLGRAVIAESADILERMARLNRRLAEVGDGQARSLTMAAGNYALETFGIAAAARMLALYPAMQMRLMSVNWADVTRAVREREASLGLLDLSDLGEPPDLVVERLSAHPAVFVVRAGHPLTRVGTLGLADILAWPFVFLGRTPRVIQDRFAAAREEARAEGPLHPAFPALVHESPAAMLAALPHSDAVAGLTLPIAAASLAAGTHVALPWRAPWLAVRCGIIRARHHRVSEAEQALVDLLRTADAEAVAVAHRILSGLGIDDAAAPLQSA